jgi:hypothetical protein
MGSGANQVPGFTVTTNSPPARSAPRSLRGRATVTDRRNGFGTTVNFSASHDGKAGFACRIGNERLGLDDLDDEAAQALRLGAMVRMAADCDEAAGCRALLTVADRLAVCTTSEQSALSGLLARALATFLEARFGSKKPTLPQADWQLARELANRAGAMQSNDDWRRVQEIVWEHLALLRKQDKAVPKALHALAERLELIKPPAEEAEQAKSE